MVDIVWVGALADEFDAVGVLCTCDPFGATLCDADPVEPEDFKLDVCAKVEVVRAVLETRVAGVGGCARVDDPAIELLDSLWV